MFDTIDIPVSSGEGRAGVVVVVDVFVSNEEVAVAELLGDNGQCRRDEPAAARTRTTGPRPK